ncbi:hypothetical protein NDU88_002238 [Pleurodeles waltl]|uniref:Uncharacterized protein n=1 Tax=Pleurodeles waltl TaxID=8319 RepID=A0AAV7TKJ0_PLEWA|nr:hypothetical protein NDU88_002238 [Pleurodeles waltl]
MAGPRGGAEMFIHGQQSGTLPLHTFRHSLRLLELHIWGQVQWAFTWRLPRGAVREPVFRDEVREAIIDYFDCNKGSVQSPTVLCKAFKEVIRGVCIAKQNGILRTLRCELYALKEELGDLERSYYALGDALIRAKA